MNIQKLSDEKLVKYVRSHDQEAYSEIIKRYQDKLIRYADYLVDNNEVAADTVQESFIKAFINLRGFNIKKKFSSWIYRIVHNEAINYLIKKKREISLESNEWVDRISKENVETEYEEKEIKDMVNKCLLELPVMYRSPLTLFYLEDKSYEEISDVLRLPVGTVGTRINRGKKLLEVIIKEKNYA